MCNVSPLSVSPTCKPAGSRATPHTCGVARGRARISKSNGNITTKSVQQIMIGSDPCKRACFAQKTRMHWRHSFQTLLASFGYSSEPCIAMRGDLLPA